MRRLLTAFLLTLLFPLGLCAQQVYEEYNYAVRGRVVDEAGSPVANAYITLEPAGPREGCTVEGYHTDEAGEFFIVGKASVRTLEWDLIVTSSAGVPEEAEELISPHSGTVMSTAYYPSLAGRRIHIKKNEEVDLGDVPLQVRFHPVLVRMLDQEGRHLVSDKDDSVSFWFRVSDPRGDLVSEISNNIRAVRESESAILISLPEGKWLLEVAALSPDRDEQPRALETLEVRPTDQFQELTLKLRVGVADVDASAARLSPKEARRELERLGFDYSEESFLTRAASGNRRAVGLFLTAGINPNAQDGDGMTALMWALNRDQAEMAQLLLDKGADINLKTKGGITALMWAITESEENFIKSLLKNGAEVNRQDVDGTSALMIAAMNEREEILSLLTGAGANVNLKDKEGMTALIMASERGSTEVMRRLLDKGAEVDARNRKGQTALMIAVLRQGSFDGMQLLLDRGADANARDKAGVTALMQAASKESDEAVQVLKNAGAQESAEIALRLAVTRGDVAAVNAVLKRSVEINARDMEGWTALMRAAEKGRAEIVAALLAHGADVNAKNQDQETALMKAAKENNGALVKLLLAKGANIKARNKDGETPLMLAAFLGGSESVKALLDRGAEVNARDKKGWTALIYAEYFAAPDVVQRLLKAGAKK